MQKVLEAAWELHQYLTAQDIPYVIIDGIAVQHWGNPRLTRDVDITILIPIEKTDHYIDLVTSSFATRISDFREMAEKNRMLLLYASNGCEVDVSIGLPGYEDELLKRAVQAPLERDKEVTICSAEDLIIHKAVAGRGQDLQDIEGVIGRGGEALDTDYIRGWLKQFSLLLETDEVMNRFERPFEDWQKWRDQQN